MGGEEAIWESHINRNDMLEAQLRATKGFGSKAFAAVPETLGSMRCNRDNGMGRASRVSLGIRS